MNKLIPIKNIYNAFQKDTFNIGQYVTYVVIGACNMNCFFCNKNFKLTDSKQNYPIGLAVEEIKKFAKDTEYIIFTGGEPLLFLDMIILLTVEFKVFYKYQIGIETNGSINLSDNQFSLFDNIVISPKAWSNQLLLKECHSLILLYPYKYANVYPDFSKEFYTACAYYIKPIQGLTISTDEDNLEQAKCEVIKLGKPWRLSLGVV